MTEIKQPAESPNQEALSQRIEFLRGLFSIWVLFTHSFHLYTVLTGSIDKSQPLIGVWLATLMKSGYLGVTGFFFLSGFCIHWSIEKTLLSGDGSRFTYRGYIKARFTRLAPIFYLGLAFALGVEWLCSNVLVRPAIWELPAQPTLAFGATLIFLQGMFGTYGCYGASWSITNEVIYYFAWPFALKALRRKIFPAFAVSIGVALLLAVVLNIYWKICGSPVETLSISLWLIPMSSVMWFVGALCKSYYCTIIKNPVFLILQKWRWLIIVLWIIWTNSLEVWHCSLFMRTVLNPFSYVVVPLVVLANWKVITGPRATNWLADLSYPLYLFHVPILVLISSILITYLPSTPSFVVVLCSGAAALALTGSVGVRAERKFMAMRRKAHQG